MTLYLDKKERVYDLKLTAYGKYLLSIGSFKPTYYAFFDDNIIYDGKYANKTESQNDPVHRIQNETHFHEGLVLFEDIDAVPSNNKGEGINYFDLDITPTKEVPRKDTFKYDAALGDAHYDGSNPNYAPAWKVVALNGKVFGSNPKDNVNNLNIPQVDIVLNYIKRTANKTLGYPEDGALTEADGIEDLTAETEPFLDNKAIELVADDAAVYVEELNTTNLVHNFDIEVFEVEPTGCKNATGKIIFDDVDLAESSSYVEISNGEETFKYTYSSYGISKECYDNGNCEDEPYGIGTRNSTVVNWASAYTSGYEVLANNQSMALALAAAINYNYDMDPSSGIRAVWHNGKCDGGPQNCPYIELINDQCTERTRSRSRALAGELVNQPIVTGGGWKQDVEGMDGATNTGENLIRKFFQREVPQIVDGFMKSETPTLNLPNELPSTSVEYYFDINVDHEADPTEICKGAETLNKDSYYIDLDFDCEGVLEENVYYDIYGTEAEPEICLD